MWKRSALLISSSVRFGPNKSPKIKQKFLVSLKDHLFCVSSATMSTNQSSSGISSGKVGVNGVDLFYKKAGSGPMPLLLMPGALGSTDTDFKPQLEGLNRELFTVVAFDPRGYGQSRPPARDFPKDFFRRDAEDAKDLMKELGYDKFCPLGWSDGAITALILAGTYMEAVDKLVIWGGNAYATDADTKLYEAVRDVSKWSDRMRAPMEAMYGADYFPELWSAWCDGISAYKENEGGDICKKEAQNISCPTLIVHGDLDAMVPMEHPQFLANTIKGAKAVHWPKAKHNLHMRYADEFNQLVEEFLTGGESRL